MIIDITLQWQREQRGVNLETSILDHTIRVPNIFFKGENCTATRIQVANSYHSIYLTFKLQAALAWWHAEPSNTSAQYAAALLALQAAAGDGLPGSFRRALAAARSALSIAERRQSPVRSRCSSLPDTLVLAW